MRVVKHFPHKVRELEHIEIPLPDGCRLAARIWLPESATYQPVPCVLEYIPYRKNDLYASRDALAQPFVAGFGYACVRVDLRGSGESDGVLRDEYLQQELQDGVALIAWLAAQPWCNGNVGMIGISWGGFNALQIAALQPPALKAIITCASTDDRYADDVHYMGGCLLTENLSWASIMFGRSTCPPDPRLVGERWRDMWLDRLKNSGLWLETWLQHQSRDDYWRWGSVCEDFSRIKCPVYAVGGWSDGYVNAIFRLLRGLNIPRKGLIGPWAHTYPHLGKPEPAIGYLQECVRWWDQWLKGRDSGLMREPMLRAWLQESVSPHVANEIRPGRWIAEPAWPSPNIGSMVLHLRNDGRLVADEDRHGVDTTRSISSPLNVGLAAGKWCSYAVPGDQPQDQRQDDAGSLVFDTMPLDSQLDIFGEVVLSLAIESSAEVSMVAARLNSVTPGGESRRITYGLLNLTHRDGHSEPQPLEPGREYRVRVPLKHVGETVRAGDRLRLAVSTSYWPLAWAPPRKGTLKVHCRNSHLQLPVRPPQQADALHLPSFESVAVAEALPKEELRAPGLARRIVNDLATGVCALEVGSGIGTVRFPMIDLTVSTDGAERYSICGDDPESQKAEAKWEIAFSRGEWNVRTVTRTVLTCDAGAFYLHAELQAFENDSLVFEDTWQRTIVRKCV